MRLDQLSARYFQVGLSNHPVLFGYSVRVFPAEMEHRAGLETLEQMEKLDLLDRLVQEDLQELVVHLVLQDLLDLREREDKMVVLV